VSSGLREPLEAKGYLAGKCLKTWGLMIRPGITSGILPLKFNATLGDCGLDLFDLKEKGLAGKFGQSSQVTDALPSVY
jgi:hypothetical protein